MQTLFGSAACPQWGTAGSAELPAPTWHLFLYSYTILYVLQLHSRCAILQDLAPSIPRRCTQLFQLLNVNRRISIIICWLIFSPQCTHLSEQTHKDGPGFFSLLCGAAPNALTPCSMRDLSNKSLIWLQFCLGYQLHSAFYYLNVVSWVFLVIGPRWGRLSAG